MKLHLAIRELYRAEHSLLRDVESLAARHAVEHEVHYTALDLTRWSQEHLRRLTDAARRRDVRLHRVAPRPRVPTQAQAKLSVRVSHRPETQVLLLADLRRLHRKASGVSLDWVLLGQGAQAVKDPELVELAQACHPQTRRQMRWANAMLKITSPQVLAS